MTVTIDNQEYFWPSIFKEIESNNFLLINFNESTDLSVSVTFSKNLYFGSCKSRDVNPFSKIKH